MTPLRQLPLPAAKTGPRSSCSTSRTTSPSTGWRRRRRSAAGETSGAVPSCLHSRSAPGKPASRPARPGRAAGLRDRRGIHRQDQRGEGQASGPRPAHERCPARQVRGGAGLGFRSSGALGETPAGSAGRAESPADRVHLVPREYRHGRPLGAPAGRPASWPAAARDRSPGITERSGPRAQPVRTGQTASHLKNFGDSLSAAAIPHGRTDMNPSAFVLGFAMALLAVMILLLIRLWTKDKLERWGYELTRETHKQLRDTQFKLEAIQREQQRLLSRLDGFDRA